MAAVENEMQGPGGRDPARSVRRCGPGKPGALDPGRKDAVVEEAGCAIGLSVQADHEHEAPQQVDSEDLAGVEDEQDGTPRGSRACTCWSSARRCV